MNPTVLYLRSVRPYTDARMFGLFKEKKQKPDIDDIVSEKWDTAFRRGDEQRFETAEGKAYAAGRTSKGFCLSITKSDCFAWADDLWFRYYDFFIEAEIQFDESNGYSSAGFLLRKIADEHYYYFLVSNRGNFRFDLVRNEEPQVLIGWTQCPQPVDGSIFLRIIMRGDEFHFMVNEEWVGSFRDETIDGGRIAFGGQNYGEKNSAAFLLKQFRINSVPMDVETALDRWSSAIPPAPEARIRLAETLSSQGMWGPAAVQLKKALSQKEPLAEELFLLGECYIKLELYPEAYASFDRVLEKTPGDTRARLEKANVLYLSNRFLELRDYMESIIAEYPDRSVCYNLLGHGEYGLGNWEKAAEAYRQAAQLDEEMPLYLIHYGRSLEKIGKNEEALTSYLKAADLLFRQEAYMDLDGLLPVIDTLDDGNDAVKAVHGKIAFHREEYAEAKNIFGTILKEGNADSTVYFLYGLCHIIEGNREVATEYLFRATELESAYYLYWFRLAENLYLLDLEAGDEIGKALELAPEDPWVLNLAGLIALHDGSPKRAEGYLSKAHGFLPDEEDISINYSQVLALNGNFDGARDVLDTFAPSAAIQNQHGNILVEEGLFEQAQAMYQKALSAEPDNVDYLCNCATVCLELDMVIRAEELFGRAMELAPAPHLYRKLGEVALRKGEYYRAEVILEDGVAAFGDDAALWKDYLVILMTRNQSAKADKLIDGLIAEKSDKPEFVEVVSFLRNRYFRTHSCDSCSRVWYVPLNIGPRDGKNILGQPEDGLPAGQCAECGKVFCIACARKAVDEGKFQCLDCGGSLKLSQDWIEYLLTKDLK